MTYVLMYAYPLSTCPLRLILDSRHFADDNIKGIFIFSTENICVSIKMLSRCVPGGQSNYKPILV